MCERNRKYGVEKRCILREGGREKSPHQLRIHGDKSNPWLSELPWKPHTEGGRPITDHYIATQLNMDTKYLYTQTILKNTWAVLDDSKS